MAQEAKKLAKKLKEEEEASQWSGIPIKKLLNQSFTEQLNYIQALQQIAPLHSAREHLPQDIITILLCIYLTLNLVSIGAQFLSVGAQFLSVGAQFLSVGAQDAPACYGLCVK